MTFWRYFSFGFEHVVPMGYDHILFVISLFLFNSKLKTAIIQCSIFTLAHSLTLALVALSVFSLNPVFVEVVIALSIGVVALENIFEHQIHYRRLILIFVFGLVHGMGFASALKEIGLPSQEFVVALLSFNLGVEVAQVFIITICFFLITQWIGGRDWYQSKFVYPVSWAISGMAFFWAVERFLVV